MNKPIYVGLTMGKSFRLIIALILLVLAGRAFNAGAQTETNLHSFGSYPTDGANPYAGLAQFSDGNFYGTCSGGGTDDFGTVFRITPSGTETTLYSFGSNPDGNTPQAGLVQGSGGYFYGTTLNGGTSVNCGSERCGTLFLISPFGFETILHSFVGHPPMGPSGIDGSYPNGLIQGVDGNFYGTTADGGTNGFMGVGLGTVFQIILTNNDIVASYKVLHSFTGSPDGANPKGGLLQGSDGNFYGTTYGGGKSNLGTVFRISSSGTETTLYSFVGSPTDGDNPLAGLIQGSDGNFYGTTSAGGTNSDGTVFRISPSGNETNLHSFVGPPNDGYGPEAGLVQGSDGNFYGTTYGGGAGGCPSGCGTVFRISPTGSYSNLYSFLNSPDGDHPYAGLVQGSDGSFYGTTSAGGTNGTGTVFKFSVPLSPPPNQIGGIQRVGTNVVVTIPSVAFETYQLQFSSSMTPTNWSNVPGVSVTNCIGGFLTVTNFGGADQPQRFYRFDITP